MTETADKAWEILRGYYPGLHQPPLGLSQSIAQALGQQCEAGYEQGVMAAASAVEEMWKAASNERTESALTSYRQNAYGPGCSAALKAIGALLKKEGEEAA